jgi:hypothetical protein
MNKIIQMAEADDEFVMLEDGFWYYWPKGTGAISEYDLLLLHQELMRRNKKWKDDIDEYFRTGPGSEASSRVDGGQTCGEDDSGISPAFIDRTPDT